MPRLFTSESVTEGHPDKIADAIADSVLDALLTHDAHSRVALETLVTTGLVVVAGEVTTSAYADIASIARQRVLEIGYDSSDKGFDGASCGVLVAVHEQSPDIAQGVDTAEEAREGGALDLFDYQGAGDQGLMFGFACDETPTLMPLPIDLSHRLAERLTQVRKSGELAYLRPDGKTQVTVVYEDGHPVGLDAVVVSSQHAAGISLDTIRRDLRALVIQPVVERYGFAMPERVHINPTGTFIIGGPAGDSGVTGRKIIVDTYGGAAGHGGGAFSGKDPSKVDRSASYAMRWVAKNIIAAGLAKRVEVQVAYAIGVARPVSVYVDTKGTGVVPDSQIETAVQQVFDLRPAAIIEALDLRRPIYSQVTCYGHFGRELDVMTWERTDRADALANAIPG